MFLMRLILILNLIYHANTRITFHADNKCCPEGQMFDQDLRCTNGNKGYGSQSSNFSCHDNEAPGQHLWDIQLLTMNLTFSNFCLDRSSNGSMILFCCRMKSSCDSIFKQVKFWGASIGIPLTIIHVILCAFVVLFYMVFRSIGRRTYNRAVIRHNACLLMMGCTLTVLGVSELCHEKIMDTVTVSLWLTLQYFTIATVLWLNVICFDMTLVITQFRWLVGSRSNCEKEEDRKFCLYAAFAWGGALVPTLLAGVFEISPTNWSMSKMRPGFVNYRGGQMSSINLYFFLLPLITMFLNNILFVYTSYKIYIVRKNMAMVNVHQVNTIRDKYFLFLRLYLLMGAPWFFGLLAACLNDLWLLKICRIIQPVLWLLMLFSHEQMRQKIKNKFKSNKSDSDIAPQIIEPES